MLCCIKLYNKPNTNTHNEQSSIKYCTDHTCRNYCSFISAITSTPENFTVLPREQNLTFSWSPPSLNGRNGVITGYFLSCVPEAGGRNSIIMQYTATGTFTLGGFTPATSYNCSISASNSQGSGPATHRVVTTLDDGKRDG